MKKKFGVDKVSGIHSMKKRGASTIKQRTLRNLHCLWHLSSYDSFAMDQHCSGYGKHNSHSIVLGLNKISQ